MSQSLADYVRGKCGVIAVSDAFRLAPWADALVSNDARWWRANPDAHEFAGRKFSYEWVRGVEPIKAQHPYRIGINSGLRAMTIAQDVYHATRILLLGFDMHGTHYFGPHTKRDPRTGTKLPNTDEKKFARFIREFDKWAGCEVLNCTPGSALTRFPFADVHEVLHP